MREESTKTERKHWQIASVTRIHTQNAQRKLQQLKKGFKRAKNLNRRFSKEGKQISKYPRSTRQGEGGLGVTGRRGRRSRAAHPAGPLDSNGRITTSVVSPCGKPGPLCVAGGNSKWCRCFGKQSGSSSRSYAQLSYDSAIPRLDTYPREYKTCSHKNLNTNVHSHTIHKRQTPISCWTDGVWSIRGDAQS